MITFTKLGEHGRLGNQLFQYAIIFVIGKKLTYDIKIPDYTKKTHHGQKSLLGCFNLSADFLNSNDKIEHVFLEPDNKNLTYLNEVFFIQDNTDFFGFFQNSLYYNEYKNDLIKEFKLKDVIIERNKKIFFNLKNKYRGYDIVSLHLRRGDTNLDIYGNDGVYNKDSKWGLFFKEAKKEFKNKKVKFLLFTGGKRYDENPMSEYEWCRKNFIGDEYIFLNDKRTTIDDFCLMQLCDHSILSPTSTFGWWVGFLNNDPNKKIIVPKKYLFLEEEPPPGFYPNNFILK